MSRLEPTKPSLAPAPALGKGLSIPRLVTPVSAPPEFKIPTARDVGNNHAKRLEELREAAAQTQPCISQEIELTPKKRRGEAARFATQIVESDDYRMSLRLRAANGTLPPAIEQMLWHYAYGQPRDKMERPTDAKGRASLEQVPTHELSARASRLAGLLAQQAAHAAGDCGPTCIICTSVEATVVQ